MSLRDQITDAVYDHPGAPAIIDAVMEVVEEEQKHARADALYWAARQLRNVPIDGTALTGPYWYGQGWKDATDHLHDLAEWDPSDEEAERTQIDTRVREVEEENTRLKDAIAARIVNEEQEVQQEITKEPLNSWLAGLLFGLQRARDIVTARQKDEK